MMAQMYEEKRSTDLLADARALRGRVDEALMKEVGEAGKSSILGLLLSVVGYLIFGLFIYFLFINILVRFRGGVAAVARLPFAVFLFYYTIFVVVLMAIGIRYSTRKRTNPVLDFFLVVPNFVRLNLEHLRDYLKSKKPIANSTIAAALLLLAEESRSSAEIVETLSSFGFGHGAISEAMDYLRTIQWIEVGKGVSLPVLTLTEKGKDIFKSLRGTDRYMPQPGRF